VKSVGRLANKDTEHRAWLMAKPLTVECAWCGWSFHGDAQGALAASRLHRITHGLKVKELK
jgi:hypothetical protein